MRERQGSAWSLQILISVFGSVSRNEAENAKAPLDFSSGAFVMNRLTKTISK
ncbi:hypothetical protein [Rufibacter sp. LB8]|uniref:hypothetical protein n=1 Tax=Rufibacter sp. LB8 TaxID=2777781 RepID=UPI00178C5877|nr:hypothetical protein [Rufibacter sp. LB8]